MHRQQQQRDGDHGDGSELNLAALAGVAIVTALLLWGIAELGSRIDTYDGPTGPVAASSSSGTTAPAPSGGGSVTLSPAEKLATLDKGGPAVRDRDLVRRYERRLERAAGGCVQSSRRVAEMTEAGVRELRERKGVTVSRLELLRLVDRSVPEGRTSVDCSTVIAVLVTSAAQDGR